MDCTVVNDDCAARLALPESAHIDRLVALEQRLLQMPQLHRTSGRLQAAVARAHFCRIGCRAAHCARRQFSWAVNQICRESLHMSRALIHSLPCLRQVHTAGLAGCFASSTLLGYASTILALVKEMEVNTCLKPQMRTFNFKKRVNIKPDGSIYSSLNNAYLRIMQRSGHKGACRSRLCACP